MGNLRLYRDNLFLQNVHILTRAITTTIPAISSKSAPVFGDLVYKGALLVGAEPWLRCLLPVFPWWKLLESVGGASGNIVFEEATTEIRHKIEVGITLTQSLVEARIFPNMLVQMTQIGERGRCPGCDAE